MQQEDTVARTNETQQGDTVSDENLLLACGGLSAYLADETLIEKPCAPAKEEVPSVESREHLNKQLEDLMNASK